jgi:hypothetical protein
MQPADDIKKLIDESRMESSSQVDRRILADALEDLEKRRADGATRSSPGVWRILMSNRMTKWAVAAVVALAVILGLSLFTGDGTSKVYARMIDQLHKAQTLTYSIVSRTGQENMPTVRMDIAFKTVGDTGWLRTATADGYITVVEATPDGVRGISLIPDTKSYVVFDMAHVPDDPGKDPWATVESLRALPAQADEVLGRNEFDGRVLDGYRVRQPDTTTTVWIDPRTGDLVRAEVAFGDAPGMDMILSDIRVDAPLDDALFSVAPPEGYEPVQVAADVSTVTEKDFIEYLRLWSSWTVDGSFPPTVSGTEIARIAIEMGREGKFRSPLAPGYDAARQQDVMFRGMTFIATVPSGTWRYAGQNVSFGDPATPIFWYQPPGATTWRVIYADLHIANVPLEDLPK